MIKVRIAPSPTGDPHVGTAYSALFNYVFARRNQGAFILRIEDTDQTRSTPESEKAIIDSLKWLGLEWDEGPDIGGPSGPYRQSERTSIYREYVQKLIDTDKAYPCFCTAERLKEMRTRQGPNTGYDGLCRNLDRSEREEKLEAGLPHVIRLKVNKTETTVFNDRIRGEIKVENATIDDQVLLKSDDFPTYHLANVVDDHLMGVTHVIRAEEWIPSTPKHVMLYEAFGWDPPVFLHLPLLRNKDKSKISKRKNPVSLSFYRDKGYLPEALLNFLALMGWSTSDEEEVFDLDRMVREMDPADLHIGSPVFDMEKLDWLNGMYIRAMTPEALIERMKSSGFLGGLDISHEKLVRIVPLIQERMKTLSDFLPKIDYFFKEIPVTFEAFQKVKKPANEVAKIILIVAESMEKLDVLEVTAMENLLRDLTQELEVKAGQIFMALRVSITGRDVTPPLLESMEIIGKETCLARMRRAAKTLAEK
ncbi:MAG: glutamate--tRNA ligase [Planctomycetes bacterium]|nr:glutamate--tRNA ligase [Planctomycetota bacterium]